MEAVGRAVVGAGGPARVLAGTVRVEGQVVGVGVALEAAMAAGVAGEMDRAADVAAGMKRGQWVRASASSSS
jgi:hypothetical protein